MSKVYIFLADGFEETEAVAVLDVLRRRFPGIEAAHRLDMDTSGIVLLARDKATHRLLQAMFAGREVTKRYVAMLDGLPQADSGTVELPLRPDYDSRPMQVVDDVNGLAATTRYEVIKRFPAAGQDGRTKRKRQAETGG